MSLPKRRLGGSDLMVTPIGLGCWQFSRARGWQKYWAVLPEPEIDAIVAASLDGGVNWFDTAESYGGGTSERELSRALRAAGREPGDVAIASKWFPVFRTARSIGRTIDVRLACLDPFPIDLYQIHHPTSFSSTAKTVKAMAALVKARKIRFVGVSNFGARRMREAHRVLAGEGLPLVSNQVHYSLLHRGIERNGVLETAKELGISIIAYSPLEQGILTGRFHDNPAELRAVSGARKYRGFYRKAALERDRPVIEALKEIAARRGATPAQVALNWLIGFHGEAVVAIPGASKRAQAASNAAAMSFTLTVDELDHLDRVSRRLIPGRPAG